MHESPLRFFSKRAPLHDFACISFKRCRLLCCFATTLSLREFNVCEFNGEPTVVDKQVSVAHETLEKATIASKLHLKRQML